MRSSAVNRTPVPSANSAAVSANRWSNAATSRAASGTTPVLRSVAASRNRRRTTAPTAAHLGQCADPTPQETEAEHEHERGEQNHAAELDHDGDGQRTGTDGGSSDHDLRHLVYPGSSPGAELRFRQGERDIHQGKHRHRYGAVDGHQGHRQCDVVLIGLGDALDGRDSGCAADGKATGDQQGQPATDLQQPPEDQRPYEDDHHGDQHDADTRAAEVQDVADG